MGFQSVMSAVGSGLKKMLGYGVPILAIASGFLPGALGGEAAAVVGIISNVERVFTNIGNSTGNGVQKLQAALPDVMNVIQASQLVSGHKIVDTVKFKDGCVQIINGYVAIMNSLEFNQGLEQKYQKSSLGHVDEVIGYPPALQQDSPNANTQGSPIVHL